MIHHNYIDVTSKAEAVKTLLSSSSDILNELAM